MEPAPLQVPQSAADVKLILAEVMAGIRAHRLDPKVGTALAYVAMPLLKAIETADLERRIAELEDSLAPKGANPEAGDAGESI
ncbi:MAG: hypothetical protein ACRD2Q_07390 [Terriglobales bacterium]